MQAFNYVFSPNWEKYEGIRPINIYLMRVLYGLMFVVLGIDVWGEILTHTGSWAPKEAMAWCVWAAFSSLALIGIFRTVKMLPILLLEIFYKVLWLYLVALPAWQTGQLTGPELEGMTTGFLWVLLPIIAVPWGYVFNQYILGKDAVNASSKLN